MNAPNRVPFKEVPPFIASIPDTRCCLWRWECRDGKWTKPPLDPQGRYAMNNAPETWVALSDALAAFQNGHGFHGIGLMLLDLKGYGFLDLDDCRDPDTEKAVDWALDLIKRSGSYTELTPSGTGFRIIGTVTENFPSVHTKVPQGDGHVEIYANCNTGRYVTITGQQVECEDLADISRLIEELISPQEKEEQGKLDLNRRAEDYTEASLPADLLDIIKTGAPVGQRSDEFFHVVAWLKDLDWFLDEIVMLLERHPNGIAEKYEGRIEQEARRAYDKAGQKSQQGGEKTREHSTRGSFDNAQPGDPWAKYPAPDLQKDIVPPILKAFAEHEARVKGVAFHGPAMAALTVCAAAIPDHVRIRVKVHEPWEESPRLWIAEIGPVSAKKSPIMRSAMAPLKKVERENAAKWAEAVERWELEDKKTRGAKPTLRRHVLNDTTVEAAGKIFAENPHGLLVERDEMAGWFGAMDKYNSGKGAAADRGFWLTAFNGGTYTVDRISRASNFIENLSASVLGGIQPDAIRRVMADAVDDGLIQRLIPVILPPAGVGEDIENKDAFQNYGALVYRLTKLPEIGEPSPNDPHNYNQARRHAVFDARAQEIRREFEHYTNSLVQLEAISPQFAAFCGKLDGMFARIALVFHCIEHINLTIPHETQHIPERVSEETARRVNRLMREFIIPHALHFYLEVTGETPLIADARNIAGYILAHRAERVTFGDLTANVRSCRKKSRDDVMRMVEPLEMMSWLQRDGIGPVPRAWTVNPAVHETFCAKAAQERERRDQVRALLRQTTEARE